MNRSDRTKALDRLMARTSDRDSQTWKYLSSRDAALTLAILDLADAVRDQTAAFTDFWGNTGVRTVDMHL